MLRRRSRAGIAAPGATWSAKLADGSDLPAWMSVDPATGKITATIPFDFRQTLAIVWTATLGGDSASAGSSRLFDGKLVARLMAGDGWPLRQALIRLIRAIRPGPLPRVWQI